MNENSTTIQSEQEEDVFARAYQSYLTGGDSLTFKLAGLDKRKRELYTQAIDSLEKKGIITVLKRGENKIQLSVTEEGIDRANTYLDFLPQ